MQNAGNAQVGLLQGLKNNMRKTFTLRLHLEKKVS